MPQPGYNPLSVDKNDNLSALFKQHYWETKPAPPPPTKEEIKQKNHDRWMETRATIIVNWKRGGGNRQAVIEIILKSIAFSRDEFVRKFWENFSELQDKYYQNK